MIMTNRNRWLRISSLGVVAAALLGCTEVPMTPQQHGKIIVKPFGQTQDGTAISLYTLRNDKGAEAGICNYGGLVIFLKMPDRKGHFGDVVLGYDDLADYIKDSPYFGAMIGRYGNRIAKGKFALDGKEYTLAINNGPNALHGGLKGFDKVVWQARLLASLEGPSLELKYVSKDGEEGYPGNLSVTAIYTLAEDNALKLEYTATTDKDTVINLTQHSYFNLAGKGDILNHVVMIPADKFTPVDSTLIPTGELRPVAGTPFDFRTPTAIGARIGQDDEQLKFGNGYDHNWVINKPMGQFGLMARVYEPTSGRVLEVLSTEPGLQFYSGNFLDGKNTGKGGWVYQVPQRVLHGAAALPRLPQPAEFPVRGAQARPGLPQHHRLSSSRCRNKAICMNPHFDTAPASGSTLTGLDWLAIVFYFGILLCVAWWVVSRAKDTAADYFLAGRNLGWWVIGASIFASNIGSEHIVGLAGSGAKDGVAMAHYELHAWCLLVLAWVFVPFYARSLVFTMPEFLERRFSTGSRYVLSIVSLVTFIVSKIAVGIFAGGVVFSTLLPEIHLNLGGVEINSFWIGSVAVIALTGLYTALGGMRAVAYNDAVQVVVLIGGSALLTFYGLHSWAAGPNCGTSAARTCSTSGSRSCPPEWQPPGRR